eukprot:gene5035-5526_t
MIALFLFSILILETVYSSSLFDENSVLSTTSRKNHFFSSGSYLPLNAVDPFPDNPLYISFEEFADSSCLNTTRITNTLMNVCMADDWLSVKFSCENGKAYQQVYGDLSCIDASYDPIILNTTQCFAYHGSYYMLKCDVVNPYDYPNNAYVVNTVYQSSTCNTEILQTNANINKYCYFSDFYKKSFMLNWPYRILYTTSENCTGPSEEKDLSTTDCSFDADDNGNDYVDYHAYDTFSYMVVGDDNDNDNAGVVYYYVLKKKSVPMSSQTKAYNPEV